MLAFDYGLRRIGVAVGQSATGSSRPLTTLSQRTSGAVLQAVDRLVADWDPDLLIVGLPLSADGSPGALAGAARRFARRLHGRCHRPVRLIDERYSSVEARTRLRQTRADGRRARVRRGEVDALAAALILETFLEHADEAHG